jgi:hypothetical protein
VTVLVRSHQLPNLPNLLALLGSLSYPSHQLSLAFLLTDPSTGSQPVFEHMVHHTEHQFHSISAYAKTMVMELPAQKNQVFELQPLKRSQWARARNFLTRSALRDEHKWVLSMDVDLEDAPRDIIQQLMAVDVDVVVPNCMVKRADGLIWGYDKANWQETELSITFTDNALDDYVYLEGKLGGSECSFLINACDSTFSIVGFWEMQTHRRLLVDMPADADRHAKVPLDGIGSCFSLSKAHVHRTGVIYPPFPYCHQLDTEGFAQMAKASGFGVYGLPGVQVLHGPEELAM